MYFEDLDDKLSKSIKVSNLSNGYNPAEILAILGKIGKIIYYSTGTNEMIITYGTQLEREMSKMYEGALINDNQALNITDPTLHDLKNAKLLSNVSRNVANDDDDGHFYQPQEEINRRNFPSSNIDKQKTFGSDLSYHGYNQPDDALFTEMNNNPFQDSNFAKPTTQSDNFSSSFGPYQGKNSTLLYPASTMKPDFVSNFDKSDLSTSINRSKTTDITDSNDRHEKGLNLPAPAPNLDKSIPNANTPQMLASIPKPPAGDTDIQKKSIEEIKLTKSSRPLIYGLYHRLSEMNLPSRIALNNKDIFYLISSKEYLLTFTAVWAFSWFASSLQQN